MRQLGIPTVVDRLVQQAIFKCWTRLMLNPTFSEPSYGIRPGRSARMCSKNSWRLRWLRDDTCHCAVAFRVSWGAPISSW